MSKIKKKSGQKLRIFIVPETHWDRAWYLPFEDFRISLVRLNDHILDTLENDRNFKTFCLDGQTVVIEDYLQIKPEQRHRLEKAVQKDRLKVGPWYILPDEFLVSGESLVRNLLIGREIAESLGKSMNVGYVPDPFGHVGQLPQILNGFGIDNFLFSRGVIWERWNKGIEFRWSGTDGSEVLALWQKDFYNNAAFLGYHLVWGNAERHIFDPERAQKQLQEAVQKLAVKTKGRSILLNNGVDHSDIQTELPAIVREARKRRPDWNIQIAGFDDYVQAISRDVKRKPLKHHTGELTYPFGDLLIGVYSARMYLKQSNAECQNLLERYAEPLAAMARVAGHEEDARPYLAYAWRQLLRNHPHDDICGCSVDTVHRDMENRFASVQQVGLNVAREGLRRLAHRLDHSGQEGIPHVIYNPAGWKRGGAQRLQVLFNIHERNAAKRFGLYDSEGNRVPYVEIGRKDIEWMECCKGFHFEAVEVVAEPGALPSCGVASIYAQPGKRGLRPERKVKVKRRGLENEHLEIKVHSNGTYDIKDKHNGVLYKGLGLFEDDEDVGDAYNWSYAKVPGKVTSRACKAKISVLEKTALSGVLEIQTTLRVPECINEDRERRSRRKADLELSTRLELRAGQKALEIRTEVVNTVRDHRLRVLFPTGLNPDKVHVDGHFDVVKRSVYPPSFKREWAGQPIEPTMTHCQKAFTDLSEDGHGLAVINRGLPEYEIISGKRGHTIALTLFRSVGWVSRGDFASRPGNAGPSVAAPEAQCLRPFVFDYAVMPHKGDWLRGKVMPCAQEFNAPIQVTRADLHAGTVFEDVPGDIFPVPDEDYLEPLPREGKLPPNLELIHLQPDVLVLSACKYAQDREEMIVRFYNPSSKEVQAKLELGIPVRRVRTLKLDETPIRGKVRLKASWNANEINVSAPAHGIVTLGITPAHI